MALEDLKYFVVPGLIGVFLMQYLYTVGSQMTLAANAGIITLTIPVIVAIFASILLKEKLNLVRVISCAGPRGRDPHLTFRYFRSELQTGKFLTGNLIFLLACCCCGFYSAFAKCLSIKSIQSLRSWFTDQSSEASPAYRY